MLAHLSTSQLDRNFKSFYLLLPFFNAGELGWWPDFISAEMMQCGERQQFFIRWFTSTAQENFPIPHCRSSICMLFIPRQHFSSPAWLLNWAQKKHLLQYIAIIIFTPGFKIRKMFFISSFTSGECCQLSLGSMEWVKCIKFQSPMSEVLCMTSRPPFAHVCHSTKMTQQNFPKIFFHPPIQRSIVSRSNMEVAWKVFYF